MMQNNPAQFLDQHVFKRFSKSISAVGFKLFYYHAQDDSRKTLWPFLKNQTDLGIIHLKRNNALKVLLSEKRAFETDRWTNTTGIEEENFSTALEFEECRRVFLRNEEEKKHFDRYFEGHRKLDVIYEDFVADWTREMERIQDFLGVPHETVRPSTYKQSNQRLSEIIANYFELKERFRSTPWQGFFED